MNSSCPETKWSPPLRNSSLPFQIKLSVSVATRLSLFSLPAQCLVLFLPTLLHCLCLPQSGRSNTAAGLCVIVWSAHAFRWMLPSAALCWLVCMIYLWEFCQFDNQGPSSIWIQNIQTQTQTHNNKKPLNVKQNWPEPVSVPFTFQVITWTMQFTQSLVLRKDFGFPVLLELDFKEQFMDLSAKILYIYIPVYDNIISLPVKLDLSLEQK